MAKIPFSLIIDDGSPLNKGLNPVPLTFVQRFSDITGKNGVKGKFSVVPMFCGKGCINGSVDHVSPDDLKKFIRIIHDEVMPNFSITPEILTHATAYDMENGGFLNVREDVYFSTLNREQIACYVGFALNILNEIGLTPSGVTSPWMCGLDNEQEYAAGIGMAFRLTMNKGKCFYFLHCANDAIKVPTVMCDSPETGLVVTVPAVTSDAFWNTQQPSSDTDAIESMTRQIDSLLSEDGNSGIICEIVRSGKPVTLLTHWQSLFSDGREFGLNGLEYLVKRINRVFGDVMEWITLDEMSDRRY